MTIPKTVKDKLWNDTYGSKCGEGNCYVCSTIINSKQFDKEYSQIFEEDITISTKKWIEQLNDKQLIASCHDLSHGGFITALVEMLIPKRIGATISLDKMPSVTNIQTEELLFAETPARYLVEVKPTHIQEVKELLDKIGVPYGFIGKTIKESLLKIEGVTTISINEILEAWRGTLPLYMEV